MQCEVVMLLVGEVLIGRELEMLMRVDCHKIREQVPARQVMLSRTKSSGLLEYSRRDRNVSDLIDKPISGTLTL